MFGFESGKPIFSNKHLNHREQVEPLISLYQDGEATPEEQRIVEFYLERCADCRTLYSAFSKIQTDLGEFLSATPVPRIDPGFYRQTPFYQANQRKQTFDGDSKANIRPFVNAASPVISGGTAAAPHRASFASSFGGLAAAIALLVGVGALLFLSINSINNNNPVPNAAQVAASNQSAAVESPTDATASATETPQPTNATNTTVPANSTEVPATNTPKNSDSTKTTSGNTTTTRNQGVTSTATIVPAAKTTTKAAGNATTTVASAVTTAPLNTVATATVAPQSPDTTTVAATTTASSTTASASTATSVATTVSAATQLTTQSPTVTPAFTTPPVPSTTPTLLGTSKTSTINGGLTVTPTVTPAFTVPDTSSVVSPTITAAMTISSTIAATDTVSATTTTVITPTDTPVATTVALTTVPTTTSATITATVSATTVPPTTANALVSAPGLIAYVSTKDDEVHLVNSDGSGDYALTSNTAGSVVWTQLVWSPDARWLAAVGKNRNNGVFSIYTLDTKSSRPDTSPVVDGFAPSWSPNSRLLAYLADATIDANGVRVGKSSVFDLKHSVSTALDNSYTGFGPQWFPDGQQLLAGQSSIYKITPSATARTFDVTLEQRVKLAFTNTCLATSLSPDGTRLANLEIATNGNLLLVYYDLTRAGNPRIPLATIAGLNNTIRAGHNCGTLRLNWTPSGHSVYFYAQSGNIYYNVLESISTGEVDYITYIYAPSFTQDGAYLVDYDPTSNQVYALPSSVENRPSNLPIIASAAFAPVWQPV